MTESNKVVTHAINVLIDSLIKTNTKSMSGMVSRNGKAYELSLRELTAEAEMSDPNLIGRLLYWLYYGRKKK